MKNTEKLLLLENIKLKQQIKTFVFVSIETN